MAKAWRRIGRLNGSDAGRMAKPVWLCANCRCWHNDRDANGKLIKPLHCQFCKLTEFDYFPSTGEAQAWCALHLRQRAGEIRNLRRQVAFDLLTVGKQGLSCVWAQAVLDFTFEEKSTVGDWETVACDYKAASGMAPEAALKFRCLEAQGIPVRIITAKGEV